MPSTARDAAMPPGTRVFHFKHGKGTVQPDPPEHMQVLVRFDERGSQSPAKAVTLNWPDNLPESQRLWCYPSNLDVIDE